MPAFRQNPHPHFRISSLTAGLIYIFINFLFVAKFSVEYFSSPILITLLYVAGTVLLLLYIGKLVNIFVAKDKVKTVFASITIVATIGMIVVIKQFDPSSIAVGRYSAIIDWLGSLSNGIFPYFVSSKPSGMPFLFFIAWPFYAIGDAGFLQVASFSLFAFLTWHEGKENRNGSLTAIILLLAAPAFWFEIVTRSDLFTNMVIGWGWLKLFDNISEKPSSKKFILTGLLGGFVLATRTILWPIFIIYLVYKMRRMASYQWSFMLSLLTGFVMINLPFLIWEFDYYIFEGPLAVQTEQLPFVAIILFLMTVLIIAFRIRSHKTIIPTIIALLFAIVGSAMVIKIVRFGFSDMLWGDQFDISYFCMVLPFLLIHTTNKNNLDDAPQIVIKTK